MFLAIFIVVIQLANGFQLLNSTVGYKKINDSATNYPKCCGKNLMYNSELHICRPLTKTEGIPDRDDDVINLFNYKVGEDQEINNLEYGAAEITNFMFGERKDSKTYPESYCVEKNAGNYTLRKFYNNIDICDQKKCIKKCCPNEYSFINSTKCVSSYHHGLNFSEWKHVVNNEEKYAIIYNSSCGNLEMLDERVHTFNIDNKGIFYLSINAYRYIDNVSTENSYCVDHFENETYKGWQFFICADRLEEHYIYFFYPLVFSCVFLLLTIIIYIILEETRKLFGKILVSYCLAILFWFTQIVINIIVQRYIGEIYCKIIAFFLIFSRSSCITWLNVLCLDIWFTFGSPKGSLDKAAQFRKFLAYSLYGWGLPIFLMLIILFFTVWNTILPELIQPYLEKGRCVFETKPGNYADAVFIHSPLIIIQVTSLILFLRTVIYYIKVKNAINRVSGQSKIDKEKKCRKDQEKLFIVLKLGIIMGVTFIFEMIASFFSDLYLLGDPIKYTEIVFNCINASQGVFIFFVFVFQKKIFKKFLKKYHKKNDSRGSVHSVTTIASTDSFSLS